MCVFLRWAIVLLRCSHAELFAHRGLDADGVANLANVCGRRCIRLWLWQLVICVPRNFAVAFGSALHRSVRSEKIYNTAFKPVFIVFDNVLNIFLSFFHLVFIGC